jgi:serine/threonine-protein kinase
MAPEQAEGRPVGPRTDLYSLGAVLYCLLARRPPFRAGSLPEMLQKHRTAQPDPVRRHAPDTPAELEHIILQLLEKDPEKRIAHATLLARRLEAMVRALSIQPTTQEGRLLEQLADQLDEGPLAAPDRPREKGLTTSREQTERRAPAPEAKDAQMPQASSRVPDGRTATHVLGAADRAGAPEAAGELPETKATDAFQAYARTGASDAAPERTGSSRFVVVGEKELDAAEAPQPPHAALISIHTWILAGALVAVGMTVWYFLQPPSADALYDRITAATADNTIESLLGAERTIQEFLVRYAGDSRCALLREQVREIELYRLERTFDRRAKGLTKSEDLLPIERAYLEAINQAAVDPHKGLARLQALVDLYQDRTDPSGPAGRCLELARRRCAELRPQVERMAADGQAELEGRLQRADEIAATNPAAARSMLQGLIDFYQDKPWAAEAVAQARAKLAGRGKGLGIRD